MGRLAGLVLALLTLAAAPATAQGGGGTPGQFDFYVLALSWSPQYCATRGQERDSRQCETGRRIGFTVHGLWPQYDRGFPSRCGPDRGAPRAVIDETADIFPDAGLARHEWRTHGTCSGLDPGAYFRAVRRARDAVRIPEPLLAPERDGDTTAQSIERAFAAVNPGLRSDMMSVACRRGELQEIRICFERDLSGFRTCPDVDRNASCRFGPIRVQAPR